MVVFILLRNGFESTEVVDLSAHRMNWPQQSHRRRCKDPRSQFRWEKSGRKNSGSWPVCLNFWCYSEKSIFPMKIQSSRQLQAKVAFLFIIWPSILLVSSLQCDRQHLILPFNFAVTSENSHQTKKKLHGSQNYLHYITKMIKHTSTDSHFPCSLKLLMKFFCREF